MLFYKAFKKGKNYTLLFGDLIIFMVLAILDIKIVELSQRLIDAALGSDFNVYNYLIYLLPCLYLGYLLLDFFEYSLYIKYIKKAFHNLASHFIKSILLSPMHYEHKYTVDDYIARFTLDLSGVSSSIANILTVCTYNGLFLILGISYLFSIHRLLTIVVLVLAFIITVIQRYADAKLPKLFQKVQENRSNARKCVSQSLKVLKEIKLNNAYDSIKEKQENTLNEYHKVYKKYEAYKNFFTWSVTFIKNGFTLAIYLGGSLFISKNEITVGEFVVFALLINRIINKVDRLFKLLLNLSSTRVSLNRVFEIYDMEQEEVKTSKQYNKIATSSVAIEFNKVSLSYHHKNVLNIISFKINRGKKVAIVGKTGCGKSTILKAMLQLFPIDSGELILNGCNSDTYTLYDWRSKFSIVQQQCDLFTASIRDNITLFSKSFSERNFNQAIDQAGLSSKPKDWFLNIYETSSTTLSGGEIQRVTLARALARDFQILLLDEFSANLDKDIESYTIKEISKLKDITLIAITHRLSHIELFDEIIVMEQGQIVEQGNFECLMSKKGVFYELYNTKQLAVER